MISRGTTLTEALWCSAPLHMMQTFRKACGFPGLKSRPLCFGSCLQFVAASRLPWELGGHTTCTEEPSKSVKFSVDWRWAPYSSHFWAHISRTTSWDFVSSCSKHQDGSLFFWPGLGSPGFVFGPYSPGTWPRCRYSWFHQHSQIPYKLNQDVNSCILILKES